MSVQPLFSTYRFCLPRYATPMMFAPGMDRSMGEWVTLIYWGASLAIIEIPKEYFVFLKQFIIFVCSINAEQIKIQ